MQVYVLTWEHRYGQDVLTFTSLERAQEERRKIAKEWFDVECSHLEKPEDRDELADLYFETMSTDPGHFESCCITACELKD